MLSTLARNPAARALLFATLLAFTALLVALRFPAPQAVAVGAPGDAYFVASMYRPEGGPAMPFRWTDPGARLLIPAAFDGPLALELRLHAAPGATPAGSRVRIIRDGQAVAGLTAAPGFRVYRLLLPPDVAAEPAPLRLEALALAAAPTYAPGDPRPLGVALSRFAVELLPGPTPLWPLVERAAAIAWGLALLVATATVLAPRPYLAGSAQLRAWQGARPKALLLVAAGTGLAVWAWRDPLGFAWAVPAVPLWVLGLLTAALPLVYNVRSKLSPFVLPGGLAPLLLVPVGHVLLLLPPPWSGPGALIVLLLPGAFAAWALFPEERAPATRAFLGICGALSVAPLLLLALHALPGPLPPWLLLLAADGLLLAMLYASDAHRAGLWSVRESGAEGRQPVHEHAAHQEARDGGPAEHPYNRRSLRVGLVLALLIALVLRLWHLGGAEFQGDEARAMLLAAAVAQGDDGLLLTHTKGPVEALLPAGPLVLAGTGVEWVARLPFALASLGVLLGALAMLQMWAGRGDRSAFGLASFVAVALLAVDGFAIGFGRIVQYQSVVMLSMAGALWCCWRFYGGAERPSRHLVAAAALVAVGVLAHYDAVMVTPALAWLVIAGGLRRGWRPCQWLAAIAAPVAVGGALLASFFVPYLRGPSFGETAAYLAGRAGEGDAGGPPFNNLPLYFDILAFYNAPPLVPLVAGMLLASVAALLVRHVRPRGLGLVLAAILGVAALVQWQAPSLYGLPGGGSWAGLAFGLPLLGLCAAPAVPAQVRAAAIWFSAALCAEAFLIAEPRTHFYTAHVPAALLVGLAAAGLDRDRVEDGEPRSRAGVVQLSSLFAALSAIVLAGGGLYGQLLYLRQLPEYQRAFPAARPAWLLARYGDALPEAGYFGFPHRDGWKATTELFRSGALGGSFDTNQNRWLAGWYLQGATNQCKGQPDLYLIAAAESTVYYPPGYALVAEVLAGPARVLSIYSRTPLDGDPRRYELAELAAAFDARPVPAFPVAPLLVEEPPRCDAS